MIQNNKCQLQSLVCFPSLSGHPFSATAAWLLTGHLVYPPGMPPEWAAGVGYCLGGQEMDQRDDCQGN